MKQAEYDWDKQLVSGLTEMQEETTEEKVARQLIESYNERW